MAERRKMSEGEKMALIAVGGGGLVLLILWLLQNNAPGSAASTTFPPLPGTPNFQPGQIDVGGTTVTTGGTTIGGITNNSYTSTGAPDGSTSCGCPTTSTSSPALYGTPTTQATGANDNGLGALMQQLKAFLPQGVVGAPAYEAATGIDNPMGAAIAWNLYEQGKLTGQARAALMMLGGQGAIG